MAETVHVLVVRSAGQQWGLPMEFVEEAFDLQRHRLHQVGTTPTVVFRGRVLGVVHLDRALGMDRGEQAAAAVIAWAGGRRRAFGVDGLVGQMEVERTDLPPLVRTPSASGAAILPDGDVVPILDLGVVAGAREPHDAEQWPLSEIQESALKEVASIGAGHAATALSQLLGRTVDIQYGEALVTRLAEAADRIGAPAVQAAGVEAPLAQDAGRVLLLFPENAGEELCRLLGTPLDDEMGRSALREVGNILAANYLNVIADMTGLALEPEPPTIEVDLLGALVERSLAGAARPQDLALIMRSWLTVESSETRFAFLFVPQIATVETLLERLGV
jgi:chemotaxis protein CheC